MSSKWESVLKFELQDPTIPSNNQADIIYYLPNLLSIRSNAPAVEAQRANAENVK